MQHKLAWDKTLVHAHCMPQKMKQELQHPGLTQMPVQAMGQ